MTFSKIDTEHMSEQRKRSGRLGPLLLGLLIAAGIAAILIPLLLTRNMMMGAGTSQTAQQFALASPGSQVKIVLEVSSTPASTLLKGTLLQKNADGSYIRTNQVVSIQWDPARSVAMGSNSDVKKGAILQVSGLLGQNDVVIASQIVVLTGFVQIK